MLKISELSKEIADYRDSKISLDDFEDWFRTNSRGAYRGGSNDVSMATVAVESALSKFRFQGISENLLGNELAAAVRPFEDDANGRMVQQFFFAANNSGAPIPIPIAGNVTRFNVAA